MQQYIKDTIIAAYIDAGGGWQIDATSKTEMVRFRFMCPYDGQ